MADSALDVFPARLAMLRQFFGYDQATFAKMLGLTPRAYQAYEAGQRRARGALNVSIAAARETGASIDWLLTGRLRFDLPRHDDVPMFSGRQKAVPTPHVFEAVRAGQEVCA